MSSKKKYDVVFLFFFISILYFLFLGKQYTYDSVYNSYLIENGGLKDLFHPHHLIYNYMGYLILEGLRPLGFAGKILFPLQLTSSFFGVLSIVLFYKFARKISSKKISFISALLLAFSYGFWRYSYQAEDRIISYFFLFCAFYFSYKITSEKESIRKNLTLGGVFHGISMLFHQYNVLFFLVPLYMIFKRFRFYSPKKYLYYIVPAATVVSIPYLIVGVKFHNSNFSWMFTYFSYWGGLHFENIPNSVLGLGNTIIAGQEFFMKGLLLGEFTLKNILVTTMFGIFFIVFLIIVFYAFTSRNRIYKNNKFIVQLSFLWFLSYAVFCFYWEPRNLELWIVELFPIWIMMTIIFEDMRLNNWKGHNVIPVLLILLLFSINFSAWFYPKSFSENNEILNKALYIEEKLGPKESIILSGLSEDVWIAPYLKYFTTVNYLSIHETMDKERGDKEKLFDRISSMIDSSDQTYVANEVFENERARYWFMEWHNLSKDEIDYLFSNYTTVNGFTYKGEDYLKIEIKKK